MIAIFYHPDEHLSTLFKINSLLSSINTRATSSVYHEFKINTLENYIIKKKVFYQKLVILIITMFKNYL